MRERTERVNGPYKHGDRWRIRITHADGTREYREVSSEEVGRAVVAGWRRERDERTIACAVAEYLAHFATRGLRPSTVTTVRYRLHGLLRVVERDRPLRSLTAAVAKQLLATRIVTDEVSADTQHGELAAASAFAAWCVAQGWLDRDPFVGLTPVGPRATGKKQLRIDEARRLLEAALGEGTPEGLAVALTLLLGCRASEITNRQVRDVDDGARVLWIDRAKTRRGNRQLEIPECLRARLTELVAGRRGDQRLWGDVDRHWLRYHVHRLCRAARVPRVTTHGLRGTQASLSVLAASAEHVAAQLGQVGPGVTRRHYLAPGAEQTGRQRAALRVLIGGAK